MEKKLESSLRVAVQWLESRGYRYAVIGGLAVSQWGFIRATEDVDIKVLVSMPDYADLRVSLRSDFPQRARSHIPENPTIVDVVIDSITVDFLFTLPGYDELVIEHASKHDLGDWEIWVCSIEDLIIQKMYISRGRDIYDVEELLIAHHEQLNAKYVETWLTQFAEALDNPAILTEYHRLLAKAKSQNA
ncbi:MAG: nucleotidyl transferase AbiEii/AbiGii toxin family protein [Chloroflexi bacterium]|nr:nucleotidyl transferase AbiEii/AbiGii toxin family protein [Chloroflexota bacterium]